MKTLAVTLLLAWSVPVLAQQKALTVSTRAVVTPISPMFPEAERSKGTRNAEVKLELIIAPTGIVQDVHVLSSGGQAFDEAAMTTARLTVFAAAKETTVQYFTVTFQLR